MTDVFEEVEEQLRADRYKTLALRALPWVLGALALALIIALAIWGWGADRQSTRLHSSHVVLSYAAFRFLKKNIHLAP